MITLRPYQQEAVDALWEELFTSRTALCVISTGGGKTEIMMRVIARAVEAKPTVRVIILVNKVQLLEQTYRRFGKEFGYVDVGMYCGSINKKSVHNKITIASIQSIYSVDLKSVDMIVLDECHNVDQESGRYFSFLSKYKNAKILAFTATPYRSTGYIYGPKKLFTKITYSRGLKDLIADGFLVRPVIKRMEEKFDTSKLHVRMGEFRQEEVERLTSDEDKVCKQIVDAIPRMIDRRKVVWACSSINHCELVNRLLKSYGEDSCTLHSKMQDAERIEAQRSFERGSARHMVFVSIVSEGYDHPPIDCVVLMRPIRSPVLYVQTCGRGLRLAPNKSDLLVLDYGGVVETLGPLDSPMISSGGGGSKVDVVKTGMKFCPQCLSYVTAFSKVCPDCHYVYPQPNSIEKLFDRAHEGTILSEPKKPKRVEIRSTSLSKFKSKNGNDCLKITYHPTNIFSPPINEYHVWGNQWAERRMMKRLIELDVDLMATLEEQVSQVVKRKPSAINVLEEKYTKVLSIEF